MKQRMAIFITLAFISVVIAFFGAILEITGFPRRKDADRIFLGGMVAFCFFMICALGCALLKIIHDY